MTPRMRMISKTVLLQRSLMAAFLLLAAMPRAHALSDGDPVPDFSLTALTGDAKNLSAFAGKIVLVNFWASWCAPCREELPQLQRLHSRFQNSDFAVVGINIDKEPANAQRFANLLGITFTTFLDPDHTVIERFKAKAMPSSYLIDRTGTVRQVFYGYNQQKMLAMEAAVTTQTQATANAP